MPKLTTLKPRVPTLGANAPRTAGQAWARPAGSSTTDRGYGWQWQQLRTQILERDCYLCQCSECKASGRVLLASQVDHVMPKSQGGSDDASNLAAVSVECHKRK